MNELSMKSDKKLPNLKLPAKGKKGVSKFMRKKAIGQMKDAVQSADRKPEKYMKPDGKMGIRMVKTDKEVIKKESSFGDNSLAARLIKIRSHPKVKAARKAHAAGTWDGNVDKEGEAVVHINGKPHTVTNRYGKKKNEGVETIKTRVGERPKGVGWGLHRSGQQRKEPHDIWKRTTKKVDPPRFKKKTNEAINHYDAHRDAQTHSDGSMSVKKIPSMIKKSGDKHLHLHMKSYHKEKDGQDFAKKHGYKVKNYVKTPSGTRMDIHKESIDEAIKNLSSADQVKAAIKIIRDKRFNMRSQIDKKTAIQKISKDLLKDPKVKKEMDKIYEESVEEVDVDEALTMQQRLKKKRDMKRNKARIAVGRRRAKKKMANMKVIKRRSDRQARNAIAKKLTRGVSKRDLTPARKKEIEKRLESPALKMRIKRLSKRMFKDVRKKEVARKKG